MQTKPIQGSYMQYPISTSLVGSCNPTNEQTSKHTQKTITKQEGEGEGVQFGMSSESQQLVKKYPSQERLEKC